MKSSSWQETQLLCGLSTCYSFLHSTSACCRVASSMCYSVGFWRTVISSTVCRGIFALAPVFSFLLWLWYPQDCFSCCLFSSAHAVFCPFLNVFPQRHHQLCWWAHLYCKVEWALPSMGQTLQHVLHPTFCHLHSTQRVMITNELISGSAGF